jgi:hypothetical protein
MSLPFSGKVVVALLSRVPPTGESPLLLLCDPKLNEIVLLLDKILPWLAFPSDTNAAAWGVLDDEDAVLAAGAGGHGALGGVGGLCFFACGPFLAMFMLSSNEKRR